MSSSKRRKLDEAANPLSPMSAVSALAARRLQGTASAPSTPPAPEDTVTGDANSFSALRKLKNGSETPSSSKISRSLPSQTRDLSAVSTPNSLGGKQSLKPNTRSNETSAAQSRLIQHSSFSLTKQNHRKKATGVVELKLSRGERFMIVGSFGVRVLAGELTVSGASLRPSNDTQWIHAPLCHALPVLRTTEKTHLELYCDPKLQNLRKLGRLSPLFRKLWNHTSSDVASPQLAKNQNTTYQILHTSQDVPSKCVLQELLSPPEWNMNLASLVSAASKCSSWIALICGPKSAGKSTFGKLLTNRLITGAQLQSTQRESKLARGVAILDLDPGQPEYTPPGNLSLVHVREPNLGVPFTHAGVDSAARKVIRCHTLASVTPASAPELYLECVADLFETYAQRLSDCPLVINTPGWILGTGLDLLVEVISKTNPTEVLYMSEDGPADTVDTLRGATKQKFTALPSQQSEFTSRTAAHFRSMQTMSYFHLESTNGKDSTLSWNAAAISSMPPWQVRYAGPHCGISAIISYDYQSPAELLADTINGMVLAAVEIESPKAFRDLASPDADNANAEATDKYAFLDGIVSRTPEALPFIPNPTDVALDPRHSQVVGLVLIRGIDTSTKSLQLITPIPIERIQDIEKRGRSIVLVHGKFDAPNWAYAEDLYERSGQDEGGSNERMELMDEDTSEDDSEEEPEHVEDAGDVAAIPWVEVLKGNQKRPVGWRVWRVRRDLGKGY